MLAMNFPISQCANIKLWRPQPKPTVIPHAQTRPKTDFTGLCLTMPRLEGTRLFVDPICVWTRVRCGCRVGGTVWPEVQGQNGGENEKVICSSSRAHTPALVQIFPRFGSSCRQSCSLRRRVRGERAIITSTMRLSHRLSPGMSLHEHCRPSTAKNTVAVHT